MVASVGVPVLLLLITEVGLRLAGFGYPTTFFLERQVEGQVVLTENADFGRRFFPPGLVRYPRISVMPTEKPAETIRIFVMGESAALGDPEPRFGLPRMLEVLLQERFPERPIEVVNVSMVAINSHVVLPIARECAGRDGDLWVVYMGNNEMIGPFGSLSVFGAQTPPLFLVRAGLVLQRTRLGQGMAAVIHRLRAGKQPAMEWGGMAMMTQQKTRLNDLRTAKVHRNFEDNLSRIIEAGHRAGVPIVLCSVATNLKDCAPFASLHREDLSDADRNQWQALYEQGVRLENAGDWTAAGDSYRRAAEIDDEYADLSFRWAHVSIESERPEQARVLYRQARDLDALQFRTNSELNERVRNLAAAHVERGVRFLDAERLFDLMSPHGVTGREFFLEHVHFNPEGNYQLARVIADEVIEALALTPFRDGFAQSRTNRVQAGTDAPESSWLPLEDCLGILGFTDWNRHQLLTTIAERMEQPPFTQQLDHPRQLDVIRRQIDELRAATKPAMLRRAAQQVVHAVEHRPDDPDLRWNLAQLLHMAGDVVGAEEQWRAVIRLWPHSHLPYYNLATLLDVPGRETEASQLYRQSLDWKPDFFEARYAVGALFIRSDQPIEAVRQLRLAVRQKPDSVPARLALGVALTQANRASQAELHFREVLRLDPENARARQYLGIHRTSN